MSSRLPPPARRAVVLARAALLWERAAPVWWPGALAALAVLAAGAAGLLQPLPTMAHAALVTGAFAAAAWPTWRAVGAFRWPGEAEARRRAEADSALRHAPLAALDDAPEGGDAGLWALHRARAEAAAGSARGRRPKAGLAAADPLALRFALPLLLAGGLSTAGPAGPERLRTAFRPDLKADASPLAVEAWATPPAYTRRPPQPLTDGEVVELPEGAVLTVTVRGAAGPPSLAGARFAETAERTHQARLVLRRDRALELRRGGRLARWRVRVTPDRPPTVAFVAPPTRGEGDALAVLYRAADDHGVTRVRLRLRSGLQILERPLDVPASPDAPQAGAIDLTATPFAGRTATAELIAIDAAGQETRSHPLRVTVPERRYTDPAAKAVAAIAERLRSSWRPYAVVHRRPPPAANLAERRLMATLGPYYALHDAPPDVKRAAAGIAALLEGAGPPLEDPVAAAGLTWALRRLAAAQSLRAAKALAPELTAVAERIETGPAGSAEEALRRAQRRLRDAVARGAPPEEVARLLDEVKQAMAAYIAALQRSPAEPGGGEGAAGTVTAGDLDALWAAVEAALARGDTEAAMALMDAIAGLLAALEPGAPGEGGGGGGRALGALRDRQRALGDETFGAAQGGSSRDMDAMARDQRRLAEAARAAAGAGDGAAGEALTAAEQAMAEAAQAIEAYDLDGAVRAQRRAQGALAEAGRALGEGDAAGVMDRALGERDPLGRRAGGAGSGEGAPAPDDPALAAREALDAIRARAADRGRPAEELRYLERLLERF